MCQECVIAALTAAGIATTSIPLMAASIRKRFHGEGGKTRTKEDYAELRFRMPSIGIDTDQSYLALPLLDKTQDPPVEVGSIVDASKSQVEGYFDVVARVDKEWYGGKFESLYRNVSIGGRIDT